MKQNDQEKESKKQNSLAFDNKTSRLKFKILFESITVALLLVTFLLVCIKLSKVIKASENEQKDLTSYISNLKAKSSDIENKITDTKKYKQVWQKSDPMKKKLDGIKASEINTIFSKLAEEYNLNNPSIKISVPETLKDGVFKTQALDMMFSTISISFDALDDVVAVNFVKELNKNIPGYHIVSSFSINKTKSSYQKEDLVNISSGKIFGSISGKIEIYWYAFKRKG